MKSSNELRPKMTRQDIRAHTDNAPDTGAGRRWTLPLAVAGILVGLGFVLLGLLAPIPSNNQETDIVALVNGRPISALRFQSLADGLNEERKARGLPPLERPEILDRLIEEELIVGRAVELGLPFSDKIARGYLINSLLAMITDEALNTVPPEEDLEWFFNENPQWFTPAEQVAAQFVFVAESGPAGRRKAADIRQRWEKLPLDRIEPQDMPPMKVPTSLVPVHKLADYLGGDTADRIARLAVGETTPPCPWMDGWLVARCMDRAGGRTPAFKEVEPQVLETFQKRQAEKDYEDYMDNIRTMADIEIVTGKP